MKRTLLLSFIFLITFGQLIHSKESSNFRFEQMPLLENLPNNEILNLYQDSDGFIWIATTGGLYRYDGYEVKEYRSNILTPHLLTNNRITCLKEGSNKRLYIGTNKGINILDKRTGVITKSTAPDLVNNYIASIIVNANNQIWISTNNGLYIYHPDNDSCTKQKDENLKSGSFKGLLVDSRGDIWIGTWDSGLFRYSEKEKRFYRYPKMNEQNSAHVIFEDSQNRIWIGSFGNGLILLHHPYDMDKVSWSTYNNEGDNKKISDNYIYSITENPRTKTIWVGTRKGISILPTELDHSDLKWDNIYPTNSPYSLPFNEVDALMSDKQGNIWVGTLGGGVRYVNTKYLAFQTNKMLSVHERFQSNSVRSILIDKQQQIWAGIGTIGLAIASPKTNLHKVYPNMNWNSQNNHFTRVQSIMQSSRSNRIWFGTEGGLYIYNPDTANEIPKKTQGPFLNQHSIYQTIEDPKEGYWIASKNGVHYLPNEEGNEIAVLQEKNEYNTLLYSYPNTLWVGTSSSGILQVEIDFKTKKAKKTKSYSISNGMLDASNIKYLYQDSKKRIWAGTDGGGLCLYDSCQSAFISVNKVTNFPTDVITSIIEDEAGTLWLGSNMGLIRFRPSKNIENSSFRIYDKKNGLPDNSFLPGAVTKSPKGELYFGTHQGYIHFFPSQIKEPEASSEVFITDLKLNNRSISALDSVERSKISTLVPGYAEEMSIPYQYNNFTIEFAPMSYFNPDKVRYTYKLEGFDREWQHATSGKRFAHYANLLPGTYLFKLKSTDEYGGWNETTRNIRIIVIPPLWRTWWAYTLYSLLVLFATMYIYRSAKQRLRLQTRLRFQQMERDKNEELNHAKLRFFTNITHELFTPITIVAAAMEENGKQIPPQQYEVIMTNINRLIRLIQQILEFRKAETGNLKLQVSRQNLSSFVYKSIESFKPLMDRKSIKITLDCAEREKEAYFDPDKIDKILYNLLSNALKYNREGAEVWVSVRYLEEDTMVRISVKDNGEGLSEKAMKNLFKRFYDGDFRKFNTSGTGIGLSLVKELINLHKGEITVDNIPGKGVCFTIQVPIAATSYSDEECSEIKILNTIELATISREEITTPDESLSQYSVLVVEDNPDLLSLIKNILERKYRIFTATNGCEAVHILSEEEIDLVVSDVMMPIMDGYELCQKIKNDIEFSHIPILLLTAKVKEEDAISAYDAGADAYLTKPFSVNILQARINNLLSARAKNIVLFKKQRTFEPQKLDYTTHDELFLKTTIQHINENYTNPEFDQNELAKLVCISKSTMHRKLKSLIGMTASNLIKEIRLKCAYELLQKQGNSRITDIAYIVGFNDPKYFSTCFKKEYGILPSEVQP